METSTRLPRVRIRKKVETNCRICGATFLRQPYDPIMACDTGPCREQLRELERRLKPRKKPKLEFTNGTCVICGVSFRRRVVSARKTCSKECAQTMRAMTYTESAVMTVEQAKQHRLHAAIAAGERTGAKMSNRQIEIMRRTIHDMVQQQLAMAHLVVMDPDNHQWSLVQQRIFATVLNKVVPEIRQAPRKARGDDGEDLGPLHELSREQLERIANRARNVTPDDAEIIEDGGEAEDAEGGT